MDNSGMNQVRPQVPPQVRPRIQVEDTSDDDNNMLSPFRRTWGSFQRRKTTKEKVQESFAIGNDIKNRGFTNRPDGDEFFNFISKLLLRADPLIKF